MDVFAVLIVVLAFARVVLGEGVVRTIPVVVKLAIGVDVLID